MYFLLLKMVANFVYLSHINQRKKVKHINNLPRDTRPQKNLFYKTHVSFLKLAKIFSKNYSVTYLL